MNVLDLFSGIGGFSLGLERAGLKTIAFCEIDPFCRKVLRKHWPDVPIFEDVKELHADRLPEKPNAIAGGFPCQDVSQCGAQAGLAEGTRSGLWGQAHRLLGEIRPEVAIFENVSGLLTGNGGGWFESILCDLAEIGFDAQWHCIQASTLGACHHRERVWIIAYPHGSVFESVDLSESIRAYPKESCGRQYTRAINAAISADDYTRVRRNHDDVPAIMERLKQYGNAVVPQIPEIIGRAIMACEGN